MVSSSQFICCQQNKTKTQFFEHFPNAAADASTLIPYHLDHFSVKMLQGEPISKIIPALTKECKDDSIPKDSTECTLLSQFEIRPPSYTTVLRWVHYLGFLQDKSKKLYYVDCHEHEAQKEHHSLFTQRYLSDLEPHRCQLSRLSLFNHHYQPTTNLCSPGTNTMIP